MPAAIFEASEKYRESVAGRVVVDTPDEFYQCQCRGDVPCGG